MNTVANVEYDGQRWPLANGGMLPFGRFHQLSLRIADPAVSNHAGIIFVDGGCWVRLDSRNHGMTVSSTDGEVVLSHRRSAVSEMRPLPIGTSYLSILGSLQNRPHRIIVHSRAPQSAAAPVGQGQDSPTRTVVRELLRTSDRRLLAALDEDKLLTHGVASPGTAREVSQRLGITVDRAQRAIAALRARLTQLGVQGMLGDSPTESAEGQNLVGALGNLAYAYGWVLPEDLDLLPASVGSPPAATAATSR